MGIKHKESQGRRDLLRTQVYILEKIGTLLIALGFQLKLFFSYYRDAHVTHVNNDKY